MKPKNEIIGPIVMRRVLKMSGLNSTFVEEPVINAKPNTIIAKPTAKSTRFIFPRRNCLLFSILKIIASNP